MKFLLATLLLALVTAPALCQSPADETAVRAVIARETEGWANYDAKKVASCYASDMIWQNPFRVRIHTPTELEGFLNDLFQRPGYRSAKDTAKPKILDLRFESPTVATVWSDESSTGQISDVNGKPMGNRHSWYLDVLVKRNGVWKIRESIISDERTP